MSLWMPPRFRDEVERDRQKIIEQVFEVEAVCGYFTKELRQIDPYLRMIRAKDNASPSGPLKAGYYHVIREAPSMPVYVTPCEWANGDYREPGAWVFEHIQMEDLWNDRAMKAKKKRNIELEAARKREKDREALDRAREYDTRLAHATNARISVPASVLDR
jgi:hypothetical protein